MKSSLEEFSGRCKQAEERIRELEDRLVEMIKSEEQTEKRINESEQSLRDLWDTMRLTNIHIAVVPKGEEKIFAEIMVENLPNLVKDMNINIKRQVRTPKILTLKHNQSQKIKTEY